MVVAHCVPPYLATQGVEIGSTWNRMFLSRTEILKGEYTVCSIVVTEATVLHIGPLNDKIEIALLFLFALLYEK